MYGPRLMEFKQTMEPAKKLFTEEIKEFTKQYDFLGKMTIEEEPDIETLDYIYSFKILNGTPQEKLDSAHHEIFTHMKRFSKEKGIYDFYLNSIIWLNRGD